MTAAAATKIVLGGFVCALRGQFQRRQIDVYFIDRRRSSWQYGRMQAPGSNSPEFGDSQGKPKEAAGEASPDVGCEKEVMRLLAELVVKLDRGSVFRIANLAERCEKRGRLDEAERLIRKCIEFAEFQRQEPQWICHLYVHLASILRRRGSWEDAERWLRKDRRINNCRVYWGLAT